LTESALGQAGGLLQSARETLVAAGNGSLGASGRAIQAGQLSQLRAQLLNLANQAGSTGGYLFGGQGATVTPFLDMPGGVTAAATGGQNQLSASEQMPTTVDGRAIWLSAPSGNGVFVSGSDAGNQGTAWIDAGTVTVPAEITGANYAISFSGSGAATTYSVTRDGGGTAQSDLAFSSGSTITVDGMSLRISGAPADGDRFTLQPATPDLSPFAALDRAIATLSDPFANAGQVAQAVNSGLRDIDAVMGHLQAARSDVGSTLTRLDDIDGRNQDRLLWAKAVQSDAEDVDMVQAISDFQNQQTGYQAALQSYASVQRMSLFDYIK
jgi:flagellar hook-associated protein 3 FlgL